MALRIIEILFPIFMIVFVGYLYGKRHRPEMSVANRLNMDIFVPALVFSAISSKSTALSANSTLAIAALILLLSCGLISYFLAPLIGEQRKTFVPPMIFNNSGNIGLPLALLAWGESALPIAVILFMVENTLHFSLGAKILDPQTSFWQLWKIPVVASAILGLFVAFFNIPIWAPLHTGIKLIGDVSIPLLLFGLGVRMNSVSLSQWKIAVGSAIVRPIIGMALAYGLALAFALPAQQKAMLLVFGALPPAVLNFLFAERYHQEPEKVAGIVLIGNLLALVFLPIALVMALM